MNGFEKSLLALIVLCMLYILLFSAHSTSELNKKQQQINELTNKVHQQIELIDALQQL